MICAGIASGKPQTGRVKLKISPGIGEAKFSLGEGKKSIGSGFTGSITEGYMNAVDIHIYTDGRCLSTTLQPNRLSIACSSNRSFRILVVGGRYGSCCQRLQITEKSQCRCTLRRARCHLLKITVNNCATK